MRLIIHKVDILIETGLQTRIGSDKLRHEFGRTRHDYQQITAAILHTFQESIHCFLSEIITALTAGQRIGFINKQNTAQRLLDDLLDLERRLADIAAHQTGTICFDEMSFGKNAQTIVYLGNQTCHRCFAGTGIPIKDHVQGHGRCLHSSLLTNLLYFQHIDHGIHVFFNGLQTGQSLQLCHQFLEGFRHLRCLLNVLIFILVIVIRITFPLVQVFDIHFGRIDTEVDLLYHMTLHILEEIVNEINGFFRKLRQFFDHFYRHLQKQHINKMRYRTGIVIIVRMHFIIQYNKTLHQFKRIFFEIAFQRIFCRQAFHCFCRYAVIQTITDKFHCSLFVQIRMQQPIAKHALKLRFQGLPIGTITAFGTHGQRFRLVTQFINGIQIFL